MIENNKTIGIIGSGMIGANVARLATAANLNVIISNSRGPDSLQDLVAELGHNAQASTLDDMVKHVDVIVMAIPFNRYKTLPVEQLANKIVIDTMNYYPHRDGVMNEIQTDIIATSELVQQHLNQSKLVRGLNNMDFVRLLTSARPSDSPERSTLPIASNDEEAKNEVAHFIHQIGYDTIDMGTLSESWRSEPTMPIYVLPYMALKKSINEPLSSEDFAAIPSRTVTLGEAKTLLSKAARHNKMFGDYLF